jgi:NADPH:quinone reductase-like Zn-dependent oxidoreductase
MKTVIVERFGRPEVLQIREVPDPQPGPGEVRVRLRSVGMNHADLMARSGAYKLSSGDPPFTPGLEGAGTIDAVGEGVSRERIGEYVVLDVRAPRRKDDQSPLNGTYRTHFVVKSEWALPVPPSIPRVAAGTLWLSHLTAWGCLVWKQGVGPGQIVGIPAASSSVGLAASQVARQAGARSVGLTRTQAKADQLRSIPEAQFDWIVVTHNDDGTLRPWYRDIAALTERRGVDVFFDPVAAGRYVEYEIRCLAMGGTIWLYGLLDAPGVVDLTPLIRKRGAIRGWEFTEAFEDAPTAEIAQHQVLSLAAEGKYLQRIAGVFSLDDVQRAHAVMEQGKHIGKFVIDPCSE